MLGKLAIAAMSMLIGGEALAAQPSWESDLRQMGYLFLHLSNINVVNGLNLTREQAVKLHGLARQVESVAAKPPALDGPIHPQLAEVRSSWLEMRQALLRGENPSKELRDRANQCFAAKSRFVRTTLRSAPTARDTRCASCHQAPRPQPKPMAVGPAISDLVVAAHSQALYGNPGLWRLALLTRQADQALTDAQRAIFGSFSCCIAPPEDLSNPTRAGQADAGSREMEILRKVRQCPDGQWPWLRASILAYVGPVAEAVSPGASAARKAALRGLVARTIDRARCLSDVEFEMEKGKLVRDVKAALMPQGRDSRIRNAYFLLIPGASEVYARYLARLGQAAGAGGGE